MDVARPASFAASRAISPFIAAPAAVSVAWQQSRETLSQLADRLAPGQVHPGVSTAFFAGSLGRMEQLRNSDADLIVIVDDAMDTNSVEAEKARDSVWRHVVDVGLPPPKRSGIYAGVDTARRLCYPSTRGVIDEDMGVFGRRFQMLLDSQPVYRSDMFATLQSAVLDRYAGSLSESPASQWTYLLNDLIRYFRSLCVRTQWIEQAPEWRLINAKLRHSRLINYAGLLLLLGEASTREDRVSWVKERMMWTPLERVAAVFAMHDDRSIDQIISRYDRFLAAMDDRSLAAALTDPATAERETDEYIALKENSDIILRTLVQFVLTRANDWHPRFFDYLLF